MANGTPGRRRHRRVRPHWDGCDCPPGSSQVDNPGAPSYARKWLCVADLPKTGPRFVRARCNASDGRDYRAQTAERQIEKARRRAARGGQARGQLVLPGVLAVESREEARRKLQMEIPGLTAPKKRREGPVDWSKCSCKGGSEPFTNKKGVRSCRKKTEGGGWAFVKASCPPGTR